MTRGRAGWLAAVLALCCAVAGAAGPAPSVHGMADTFAAPGVSLAWGVLRDPAGGDAASVIIRVVTDAQAYPVVAAVGVDPFTQAREPRLAATRVGGGIDVRVPRARFADYPRTEFLLFDSAAVPPAGEPKLVVFYLGVPDTTPEFAAAAALDAHLAQSIARLARPTGAKSP